MKQYCRYCVYLVAGNGTYCEAHEKELSDSYAKRANSCKDFEFCRTDAYGEKDYTSDVRLKGILTCDICKRESTKGAGLIVMYERDFSTLIKPKIRKDVKPLTPMRYVYYLRLFAKKWVRKREGK